MHPLRVLIVNHAVEIGGAERVLLRLVDSLDRQRFELAIACPHEGPLTREMDARGVPVLLGHPSGRLLEIRRRSLGGGVFQVLTYPFDLLSSVFRLARLVRRERFDLLFTNSAKADIYGTVAARLALRPSIIRLHDIVTAEAFSSLNIFLMGMAARFFANKVSPVSEASGKALLEMGVPSGKIKVLYNGIDLDAESEPVDTGSVRASLGVSEDAPVAGLVGRLVDWKAPDLFIEAAARVALRVPDARFVIVGDTTFGEESYLDYLVALVGEFRLEDRLIFTGWSDEVSEIVASLDLLVHCSNQPDPLPTVLVEAMARGVPVVAADGGGVPEIVDNGVTGFTYPAGDVDALAEAIAILLSSGPLAQAMGAEGRHRAEGLFDIRATTPMMETLMLETFSGSGCGRLRRTAALARSVFRKARGGGGNG